MLNFFNLLMRLLSFRNKKEARIRLIQASLKTGMNCLFPDYFDILGSY